MTSTDLHGDIFIREYKRGDFGEIKHLWELTDMGNPKRGDDESAIEESIRVGGKLLILEDKANNKLIGTSWLTYDGRRIYLHHFGIHPDYQGKGLANLLMDNSLKFVKKSGCQVKLEVHRTNIKAIKLYKKYGFIPLGDFDVYIIRDIGAIK